MPAVEARIDRLEDSLASFIEESRRIRVENRERNARTDAQLLRMQEQAEKERRDFNRRMVELSDSMGTLVEDMVAPNADRLAAQIFGDDPVIDISQRVRRRRGGESMELDLLAAGSRNVMVVESKRRLRTEDPDSFLLKLQKLVDFFPEDAGYRIVPVMASVTIEPSMVSNLTRRKVYGIAFGDETMELVNLGQF